MLNPCKDCTYFDRLDGFDHVSTAKCFCPKVPMRADPRMAGNYRCAACTETRYAKGFWAWLTGECGPKGRWFERRTRNEINL